MEMDRHRSQRGDPLAPGGEDWIGERQARQDLRFFVKLWSRPLGLF
jgi:hypothetical protein